MRALPNAICAERDIIGPATGEVIATVQEATAEDADRAIAAAKRAFEQVWFDSTPKERMQAMLLGRKPRPAETPLKGSQTSRHCRAGQP